VDIIKAVKQAALKSAFFHFLIATLGSALLAGAYAVATQTITNHGAIDITMIGVFLSAFTISLASSIIHYYNSVTSNTQIVALQQRLSVAERVATPSACTPPVVNMPVQPQVSAGSSTATRPAFEITVPQPEAREDVNIHE
jgi:hypothetical protein